MLLLFIAVSQHIQVYKEHDPVTKKVFMYCQLKREKKKVKYLHNSHVKRYSIDAQPLVSIKRPVNVIEKKENQSDSTSSFTNVAKRLLAVPHSGDLGVSHLLLQLEDTEHEGFGGRWATGNVDIDGDDTVTAAGDGVRVVVVTTTVGA
jgi:hypothetical protein